MQNRGLDVALAAPTGRDAKRMTELTGCEAKTVHRLLEVEYKDGSDEPVFVHKDVYKRQVWKTEQAQSRLTLVFRFLKCLAM